MKLFDALTLIYQLTASDSVEDDSNFIDISNPLNDQGIYSSPNGVNKPSPTTATQWDIARLILDSVVDKHSQPLQIMTWTCRNKANKDEDIVKSRQQDMTGLVLKYFFISNIVDKE